jgi:hypothetical protein
MCPDGEGKKRTSKFRAIASSIGNAGTAGREWATGTFGKARTTVSEAAERSARAAGAAADAIGEGAGDAFERAKVGTAKAKQGVVKSAARAAEAMSDSASAIAAFLALPELLKWSEQVTKSAATIYDKALDAEYLRTHIGGGSHRLFDGGHDLVGAWTAVREASETDSFAEEVIEYVQALWKDATTIKGLPFVTWDKVEYSQLAEALSTLPGISKEWVYDLLSYDVFEVFSAGLGAVGIIFAFGHDDLERLSELLGTMGITSVISANPLMGLAVIATTGYAYWRKSAENGGKPLCVASATKGAALAGLSGTIFAVLGLPVLVELMIAVAATQLARKHVFENKELGLLLARTIQQSKDGTNAMVARLTVAIRSRKSEQAAETVAVTVVVERPASESS